MFENNALNRFVENAIQGSALFGALRIRISLARARFRKRFRCKRRMKRERGEAIWPILRLPPQL
jgi:hypothetical protein